MNRRTLLAGTLLLMATGSFANPAPAQSGTGGSVNVTLAKPDDFSVFVVSGDVTVTAGVTVTARATYFKVEVPKDKNGGHSAGKVKSIKWTLYRDVNGNNKYDPDKDSLVDDGSSTGETYAFEALFGTLVVNRLSDNLRLSYEVQGSANTVKRDTAMSGVL